jgi:hypothetical protein
MLVVLMFRMQDDDRQVAGAAVSSSPLTTHVAQEMSHPAGEGLGDSATPPAAQGVAPDPPAEGIDLSPEGWPPAGHVLVSQ